MPSPLDAEHSCSERGPPAWTWPGRLRRPLSARFDKRFYPCPSGDLGGEEGCAADRASAMLEPAARRGAGGSGTFKGCQSLVEGIPGLRLTPSACRDFTMQNALFLMSAAGPTTYVARTPNGTSQVAKQHLLVTA